jgi:hypothetical protein
MDEDKERKLNAELGAVLYATHKINDKQNVVGGVDQSVNVMAYAQPKAGSYKYTRPDTGEEIIVQPGDRMYSSAGMLATEFFDGEKWCGL